MDGLGDQGAEEGQLYAPLAHDGIGEDLVDDETEGGEDNPREGAGAEEDGRDGEDDPHRREEEGLDHPPRRELEAWEGEGELRQGRRQAGDGEEYADEGPLRFDSRPGV